MRKTLIQRKEVGAGGAASIEFTNIPQTYTDLLLVMSMRTTVDGAGQWYDVNVNFNGVSTNQSQRVLYGAGSGSGVSISENALNIRTSDSANTANTFGNASFYVPNYRGSAAKSISMNVVSENNATGAFQAIQAGLWNSSDAITSISLVPLTGNLEQYSSASLYGVSKYNVAGGSPKATGGIISYDSTADKWVHTFTASGTFTPTEDMTCEYLVIAGGGSGGSGAGGGGGAGGYRCSVSGETSGRGSSAESPLSLTASTGYLVTVGAGGASQTSVDVDGFQGSNSVFATITSTGGGRGAGYTGPGGSGGSGGGASYNATGGSGTAAQGYDGAGNTSGGGGGGGAGASASVTNGGNGLSSSITGFAVTRAGGGGGFSSGIGGTGGGATAPADFSNGDAGEPNTGGGGSGTNGGGDSGAGGSGIVIVRYSA